MSPTEMAKALGVPLPRITEWRKRGMPMDDAEAARAWREQNAPARAPRGSVSQVKELPMIKIEIPESGHSIDGTNDEGDRPGDAPNNPYDALREAKNAEKLAQARLRAVIQSADQVDVDRAQRTFTLAQRHRIWMHAQVRVWAREKGITLYSEEAKLLYGTAMQTLIRLLNVMPKALSPRCTSPQLAETAMAEYIERIRKAIQEDLMAVTK